jgi:multiple sugar transport system permease protein
VTDGSLPVGTPEAPWRRVWRREAPHVALILPAFVILLLFFVIPAGWAVWTSLTDRALLGIGAQETRFVGLANFRQLWNNPDFLKILWNTVVFVGSAAVLGQTALGFTLALLLEHARRAGSRLVPVAYAAVLVAWITPPAFAGAIWGTVYDPRHGVLTEVQHRLGLEPIQMLAEYPMLAVIIAESWRGVALPMVIFLGALRTLPPAVFEAAEVDGAGPWRRFSDMTLPLMGHIMAIVLMVTTIAAMGSFLLIQILTNGGPGYQTETIALFAFHRAFVTYEIAFGAAIAVVMLALNLIFAGIFLRIARVGE